jgi:hypothetical protein
MDNEWNKQKTIGNIAENVVEMLIDSISDWKCIKFGIENHIDDLKKQLRNNLTSASKKVRSMPDFIAINTKTSEIVIIDVKYRSFLKKVSETERLYGFGYKQIKDYLEYWGEAKLIVVHHKDPYFFVIDLKDVEKDKHFHSKGRDFRGVLLEQWNFKEIEKDIKSIFPDLKDEKIDEAKRLIPFNKE